MEFKDEYLSAYKDLILICTPFLKELNIKMFAYSRVFNDGSRSELWTNIKALEHTFIKKKYISNIYTPNIYDKTEKYVILSHKIKNMPSNIIKSKYENQIKDQIDLFENDNCFNIINKKNEMCEYFIFYTNTLFKDPINFYFNNTHNFEKFIRYFKKTSKNIIAVADKNKVVAPNTQSYNGFYEISPIYHESPFDLSEKEIEVCKHIKEGRSSIETGIYMSISHRTVEKYIERIKAKIGCNKKTEILIKILETNFLK